MKKVYRLQAIGGSYYIALPKEWLRRLELGKGSYVEVSIEHDGTLKIKPIRPFEKEEIEKEAFSVDVDIDIQNKESVYTLLISLYLGGYDLITLHLKDDAARSAVRNAINKAKNVLLGFEIVDEDSSSITLHVLSSSDTDVLTLIRNMNKIARSMYLDVLPALIKKDLEKAYEIEARDQDLNRLYFYITRVIRKKVALSIEPNEILRLVDLRMMAKAIEEIGDDAKKAAKIVQEIILNDVEVDLVGMEKIGAYVNELDSIHRNVVGKPIPLHDLIKFLHNCDKIMFELSNLRRSMLNANVKGYQYLSELIYTYENIAMHIYDIMSLTPISID